MEQSGLTRKELEPYIGARGRVSEVLNSKRIHDQLWKTHLHYLTIVGMPEAVSTFIANQDNLYSALSKTREIHRRDGVKSFINTLGVLTALFEAGSQ